jgi:hypothetical protein
MAYIVKARYYADPDQLGESYVITSDNGDKDTKFEIGERIQLVKPVEGITVMKIQDSAPFTKESALVVHGAAEYIRIVAGCEKGDVEVFRGNRWHKADWHAKMKRQGKQFMEIIKEE